eukprot:4405921-Pyramimonas_sp.AAC.1
MTAAGGFSADDAAGGAADGGGGHDAPSDELFQTQDGKLMLDFLEHSVTQYSYVTVPAEDGD